VSSAVTIAIAEKVTIPNRILQISPASSAANISYLEADKDTDLLFRTNLSDALQGVRLAALAREKGYNKVSSLYVDNAYGQSIDRVFTESFGKEYVVANVAHPDGSVNSSFTTELSWLAVNGSEALAAFSYPHQIDIYVKEAIDYGFFKNFLFASGGKSKNLVTLVGAEALEGMCGTQPGLAQSDSLELFKANYQKKFGEIPSLFPYAAATYDAIVSATLAAYAAEVARETVTGTTIRNHLRKVAGPDGERVVAGLDSLKRAKSLLDQGKDINYLGASGEVDYDAVGDVARPVDVWCYQNGEMVVQP
jgi:ABC-type branched-subunit amino acid transport system substrate-binding protein